MDLELVGVGIFVVMLGIQLIQSLVVGYRNKDLGFSAYCRACSKNLLRWSLPWFIATVAFGLAGLNGGPEEVPLMMGAGLATTLVSAGVFALENKSRPSRK